MMLAGRLLAVTDLRRRPAFLFDLDGTLIDSVYQHVVAWREALSQVGLDVSVWRIHRRIGMSGGLFLRALATETGIELTTDDQRTLAELHATYYAEQIDSVHALPGATDLLDRLTDEGIPWTIATSSWRISAALALDKLGLPAETPIITRDEVRWAKPDPDLFLAAANLLGVDPTSSMVVGDSIWDLLAARRAGSLGIGLLSGGYGREELERAAAFRVYDDPADMLARLHELGVRP